MITITPWGASDPDLGLSPEGILPLSRTAGEPQKPTLPACWELSESASSTSRPANSERSTRAGSQRWGVVTVRSKTVSTLFPSRSPGRPTLTRKVVAPSSMVPTAKSSQGRAGISTLIRIVSGDRATSVSRKTFDNPCQPMPAGMPARYSLRKMRRTDSISKRAPLASVGRRSRWRISEEATGRGGRMV